MAAFEMNAPSSRRSRFTWARPLLIALGLTLLVGQLTGCGGRRRSSAETPQLTTRPWSAEITPGTGARSTSSSTPVSPPPGLVIGAPLSTPVPTSQPEPPPPQSAATIAESVSPPELPERPREIEPARPNPTDVADEHGYSDATYAALLTPDETQVLRLRARGDTRDPLTRYLTVKERENLRRRSLESTEIGGPRARVGE